MDRSAARLGQAPVYFYELDENDRIISASESWDAFAEENDGRHLVRDKVRGDRIWDHIADPETKDLYRRIFATARKGKPVQFFLRCDSPGTRRMLSVTVSLAKNARDLLVCSMVFRSDERPPIDLRGEGGVKLPACSWCEKVMVPEVGWQEIEGVAGWLGEKQLPGQCRFSYTICDDCRSQIEKQLSLALERL